MGVKLRPPLKSKSLASYSLTRTRIPIEHFLMDLMPLQCGLLDSSGSDHRGMAHMHTEDQAIACILAHFSEYLICFSLSVIVSTMSCTSKRIQAPS